MPQLYNKAMAEREVVPLGQAEIEITRLDDGKELAFTAEVDVRPSFELPDLEQLSVTVDNAEVDPDQVEEYLRRAARALRVAQDRGSPGADR